MYEEINLVALALAFYLGFTSSGESASSHPAALSAMAMTDSMQQYAVHAIEATAALGSFSTSPIQQGGSMVCPFFQIQQIYTSFLGNVAGADKMPEWRLSALLTNKGILTPLRTAVEGRAGFQSARLSSKVLHFGCGHFQRVSRSPEGSPVAHRAAQHTVLGALRQSAALLHLAAVAPAQRQLAVERARAEGFLQVGPFHSMISFCSQIAYTLYPECCSSAADERPKCTSAGALSAAQGCATALLVR